MGYDKEFYFLKSLPFDSLILSVHYAVVHSVNIHGAPLISHALFKALTAAVK
jgi:hypothetical protein